MSKHEKRSEEKKKTLPGKAFLQLDFKNGDPKEVYPLENRQAAMRCFDMLNQCRDMDMEIKVIHLSNEDWLAAKRVGNILT